MSDIPERLKTVRTLEEVVQLLNILFTNLNNQNEIYYDMFLNPEKLDIELERYDETGKLVTVTLPNRAKSLMSALTGNGDPNSVVAAEAGTFYIDLTNYNLYYKAYGSDTNGWISIWTPLNLRSGTNYLAPNGNGSRLTDLNMDNANSGILRAINGGTGVSSITGIIKGRGTEPFAAAEDGVDYLGPNSMTGVICYYPVYDETIIGGGLPNGWLRCDGAAYSRTMYGRLFRKIGTAYGIGDGVDTFNIPNLLDVYLKCWDGVSPLDGTIYDEQVGRHKHIALAENQHKHGPGDMHVFGTFSANDLTDDVSPPSVSGAFGYSRGPRDATNGSAGGYAITFDAYDGHGWSGSTGTTSHTHEIDYNETDYVEEGGTATGGHNEVRRVQLVPIIKY